MFFPQSYRCFEKTEDDFVQMQIFRKSNLIGILTSSNVIISDISQFEPKKICEYKRNEESIHEFGMNHWIQWMSKDTIAFGTRTGIIFIYYFGDDSSRQSLIVVKLNQVITAQFSYSQYLGIFSYFQDQTFLIFISPLGQKVYMNSPGISRKITDTTFYSPNLIIGLMDQKPFVFTLSSIIHSDIDFKTLSYNYKFHCESPSISCFDFNKSVFPISGNSCSPNAEIAFVCSDNSFSLYYLFDEQFLIENPLQIIPPPSSESDDEIIMVKWFTYPILNLTSKKGLLFFLSRKGSLIIFDLVSKQFHRTRCDRIKGSTQICFDSTYRNLLVYIPESHEFGVIEFQQMSLAFSFSCTSVIDLKTFKYVGSISKTIPTELYPITKVVKKGSIFVIASSHGFITIDVKDGQNQLGQFFKIDNLINLEFCDECLFVFFREQDILLSIFDETFNIIDTIKFPHIPLIVSSDDNNRIAISANNKYSIITIKNHPEIESNQSNIECIGKAGCKCLKCTSSEKWITIGNGKRKSLLIQTSFVEDQLLNCAITKDYGIILHFWSGTLSCPERRDMFSIGVLRFIVTDNPQIIIMETKDGMKLTIDKFNIFFPFHLNVADGASAYNFPNEIQFGSLAYQKILFSGFLLSIFIDQPETFSKYQLIYSRYQDHAQIYSSGLYFAIRSPKIAQYCSFLNGLPEDLEAKVFFCTLKILMVSKTEEKLFLSPCDINFERFFDKFEDEKKVEIIRHIPPSVFDNFANILKKQPVEFSFKTIQKLIKEANLLRAFQINEYIGSDFILQVSAAFLDEMPFEQFFLYVKESVKKWPHENVKKHLQILASILMLKDNFKNLAFVVFLEAKNKGKIQMFLHAFPELNEKIKMIQDKFDDEEKALLSFE